MDRPQPFPPVLPRATAAVRHARHQRVPACRREHLLFNVFTLWAFSFKREQALGTPRFAALYAFGLLASDADTWLNHRREPGYALGTASGANAQKFCPQRERVVATRPAASGKRRGSGRWRPSTERRLTTQSGLARTTTYAPSRLRTSSRVRSNVARTSSAVNSSHCACVALVRVAAAARALAAWTSVSASTLRSSETS